jgi:hypothetical protein
MYKKSIAMTAVLVASVLAVVAVTSPLAYADRDSYMKDDDKYGKDHDKKDPKDRDEDRKRYDPGGDSSETGTEQEIKQKNVGSGESVNDNCGQNLIDSALALTTCATIGVGAGG